MCKLCNTTEPPKYIKPKVPKTQAFIATVKDYIGTYPCRKCINSFNGKSSKLLTIDEMDKYVLTKLYKNYRQFRVKAEVPGYTKERQTTTSYLGIEIITNNATGEVLHRVRFRGGSSKCFSTFDEAFQWKLELLSKGAHPKSVTRLTNKLKELQNETN